LIAPLVRDESTGRQRAAPSPFRDTACDDQPMASGSRTILLVEDEVSISGPLADALRREGFETVVAGTAAEALEQAPRVKPDLVLLDLMLPDGSGYDVCRELRRHSEVPIVMLTARGEEADRIVGLELGADDYVVKPFSAREVIARIRAILRRTTAQPQAAEGPLEIDGLVLDPARRSVELDGAPVELSRKEFELLQRLMSDAGRVITRETLIADVWDMNWFGSTKTLDVHIAAVRRKLAAAAGQRTPQIVTLRGVGFRLDVPAPGD
jgi:two-component system response regulator RegX3